MSEETTTGSRDINPQQSMADRTPRRLDGIVGSSRTGNDFSVQCVKIRYPCHFLVLASLAFLRAEFFYDIEIIVLRHL